MEQRTENIKLVLGRRDPIRFYLVLGDGYLSAETTDPRDADALVTVREFMDMATLALSYGVPLQAVCDMLKYNMDGRGEHRPTNTLYVPRASSVPDLVGRYLETRLIKVPIIRRILNIGLDYMCESKIDPVIAVDDTGRLYIDWSVAELRRRVDNDRPNR